jgi:hypothetical protein
MSFDPVVERGVPGGVSFEVVRNLTWFELGSRRPSFTLLD